MFFFFFRANVFFFTGNESKSLININPSSYSVQTIPLDQPLPSPPAVQAAAQEITQYSTDPFSMAVPSSPSAAEMLKDTIVSTRCG